MRALMFVSIIFVSEAVRHSYRQRLHKNTHVWASCSGVCHFLHSLADRHLASLSGCLLLHGQCREDRYSRLTNALYSCLRVGEAIVNQSPAPCPPPPSLQRNGSPDTYYVRKGIFWKWANDVYFNNRINNGRPTLPVPHGPLLAVIPQVNSKCRKERGPSGRLCGPVISVLKTDFFCSSRGQVQRGPGGSCARSGV